MQPDIHLNGFAILTALAADMALGFLWFGPLFGKAWATEMKMSMDKKPPRVSWSRRWTLQAVGTLLTVWVLAHEVQVWRPSVWGVGPDGANLRYGFFSGFSVWLDINVPPLLGQTTWEREVTEAFRHQCRLSLRPSPAGRHDPRFLAVTAR